MFEKNGERGDALLDHSDVDRRRSARTIDLGPLLPVRHSNKCKCSFAGEVSLHLSILKA